MCEAFPGWIAATCRVLLKQAPCLALLNASKGCSSIVYSELCVRKEGHVAFGIQHACLSRRLYYDYVLRVDGDLSHPPPAMDLTL